MERHPALVEVGPLELRLTAGAVQHRPAGLSSDAALIIVSLYLFYFFFFFLFFFSLSLLPFVHSLFFVFAFCCSQPEAQTSDEFMAAVLKIVLALSLIGGAESPQSCPLVTEQSTHLISWSGMLWLVE
jgi:hypothetical protein